MTELHNNPKTDSGMTLFDHLEELRQRLLFCLITILLTTILGFVFAPKLLLFITSSVPKLVVIAPLELIILYLKLSVVFGLFLACPLLLYQLWAFVQPGLYPKEKKYVLPFVSLGWIFFVGGAVFAYFMVIPLTTKMFWGMTPEKVLNMWSTSKYVSFVLGMVLSFGIVFLVPVIIVLLGMFGLISSASLWRWWRGAILIIFILAAFLTPADVLSQLLLAFPLGILFFLSILFLYIWEKRKTNNKK